MNPKHSVKDCKNVNVQNAGHRHVMQLSYLAPSFFFFFWSNTIVNAHTVKVQMSMHGAVLHIVTKINGNTNFFNM